MKFTTPARRVLAAGAVSALAAGALVTTTATTANAAPGSNVYSCTTSAGPQNVTVDVDVPLIGAVTQLDAGQPVDPAVLPVTIEANLTFTISNNFKLLLGSLGVQEMEVPAYGGDFGNSKIPVEAFAASVTDMTQNEDTTWSVDVTTPVIAFKAPAAGTAVPVQTPKKFGIVAQIGGEPADVTCTRSDAADVLTTIDVVKTASTTTGKSAKRSFAKGTNAKVNVTVAGAYKKPSGQVILKKGTKTLDKGKLRKGKAVLSTKALKVGKNKLTVIYKGDGYYTGSKDAVTVKVTR
ncbi:hypothetical protein GCM10009623_30020 [Nocardioides aestuarii]|uniref:Ig-like domain-containing protein n=1 Tax=Nocardioides aestuarii TaxID=252231 RepID=A0ABW4TP01_9ACTN